MKPNVLGIILIGRLMLTACEDTTTTTPPPVAPTPPAVPQDPEESVTTAFRCLVLATAHPQLLRRARR